MTPEQLATLRHFTAAEFRHAPLVDYSCATFLDQLREAYGLPLVLTSDARTPAENAAASGSSPTSLHLAGRAFDLAWPGGEEEVWRFLTAFFLALGWTPPEGRNRSVELELVHSATDKHVHFGIFPNVRPSRLLITAD